MSFKGGALSLQQWGQQGMERPQLGRRMGCLGLSGAPSLQGMARPSSSPDPSTALCLQSLPSFSNPFSPLPSGL